MNLEGQLKSSTDVFSLTNFTRQWT